MRATRRWVFWAASALLGVVGAPLGKAMAADMDPAKAQALFDNLRNMALAATPDKLGLPPDRVVPGKAYGALMEFAVDQFTATLYCAYENTGDAIHVALYTSSGFMIIGQNWGEPVFRAARLFVELASDDVAKMAKTDVFPKPIGTAVRFYALTDAGVFTVQIDDDEGDWTPLVSAGNDVVTAIRQRVPAATR